MTASTSFLFLDIDGVLNGHEFDEMAQSCTILEKCVKHLNRVIVTTGCSLVISSAWRYMLTERAMSLSGFSYLLRTHGVAVCRIAGHTRPDSPEESNTNSPAPRVAQILNWIETQLVTVPWAVVDDLDLSAIGERFVRTSGKQGLTSAHADALIEILRK